VVAFVVTKKISNHSYLVQFQTLLKDVIVQKNVNLRIILINAYVYQSNLPLTSDLQLIKEKLHFYISFENILLNTF